MWLTTVSAILVSWATVYAQSIKPNILVIFTDYVGVWNIGAYHRGMMGGSTPNIDRIAKEGALFTAITPNRAVLQGKRRSSPVKVRFALAC